MMAGYRRLGRLTADEERQLGLRIRAGDDDAWRELVLHCVPLVFTIVRRLSWAVDDDPEDMAQLGIMGLMKAARRYDPEGHPGHRFSSYAAYAIRNSVRDAYGRRGLRPLPDYVPPQDPGPGPLAEAELVDDLACMRLAVGRLCIRSRRVIEGRYFRGETLEEIGLELGLTRERVRQIEQEALAEMRKMMGVGTPEGKRSCRTSGRSAAAACTPNLRPSSGSRRGDG